MLHLAEKFRGGGPLLAAAIMESLLLYTRVLSQHGLVAPMHAASGGALTLTPTLALPLPLARTLALTLSLTLTLTLSQSLTLSLTLTLNPDPNQATCRPALPRRARARRPPRSAAASDPTAARAARGAAAGWRS